MAVWLVSAVWQQDEGESRDRWEVHAVNAHEDVRQAMTGIPAEPLHIEARRVALHEEPSDAGLQPGEMRRVPLPSLPAVSAFR